MSDEKERKTRVKKEMERKRCINNFYIKNKIHSVHVFHHVRYSRNMRYVSIN